MTYPLKKPLLGVVGMLDVDGAVCSALGSCSELHRPGTNRTSVNGPKISANTEHVIGGSLG